MVNEAGIRASHSQMIQLARKRGPGTRSGNNDWRFRVWAHGRDGNTRGHQLGLDTPTEGQAGRREARAGQPTDDSTVLGLEKEAVRLDPLLGRTDGQSLGRSTRAGDRTVLRSGRTLVARGRDD